MPAPPATAAEPDLLSDLERTARDLADAGGRTILRSLRSELSVTYKSDFAIGTGDPVSQIDREVELGLRQEIARRFPDHAVIGEETEVTPSSDAEWVWVIDPIDGTTNFIHRYPFFATAVAVLRRGEPIAGAIWCSCTEECRPGTYHVQGGSLHLDDRPVVRDLKRRSARRLVGDVGPSERRLMQFDRRASGSAAIECAFVAAGLLDAARFRRLWIWDVAAGVALLRAAGVPVWTRGARGWIPFERFSPPRPRHARRRPTLRDWHRPLFLGTLLAAAVAKPQAPVKR